MFFCLQRAACLCAPQAGWLQSCFRQRFAPLLHAPHAAAGTRLRRDRSRGNLVGLSHRDAKPRCCAGQAAAASPARFDLGRAGGSQQPCPFCCLQVSGRKEASPAPQSEIKEPRRNRTAAVRAPAPPSPSEPRAGFAITSPGTKKKQPGPPFPPHPCASQ